MPPVTVLGLRTKSVEVLPDEAAGLLAGPRSAEWAEDYPTHGTRLSVERFLTAVAAGDWAPGFGMYTVRPLGGLICGGWAFYSRPDPHGWVETGYGLAPSGRRQGLMSDAVRSAVAWARGHSAVRFIWAGVDHNDLDSIRVLEAARFNHRADHDNARRCTISVGEVEPRASEGGAR